MALNLNNGHKPRSKEHQFHFLDMVRCTKKTQGVIDLAGPNVERTAFFQGALGRVIDYTPKGYKVFFPVPHFPAQGILVEISDECLTLERGVTEAERFLAHLLPMSEELPVLPGVTPVHS